MYYTTPMKKSEVKGYWCHACFTETRSDVIDLDGTRIRKVRPKAGCILRVYQQLSAPSSSTFLLLLLNLPFLLLFLCALCYSSYSSVICVKLVLFLAGSSSAILCMLSS